VDSPRFAPEFPACGAGVFLLDDEPITVSSGSRGTRTHDPRRTPVIKTGSRAPTEGWSQPDDFRSTVPFQGSGSWNRTNGLLVQSQVSHASSDNPGAFMPIVGHYRLRPSSSLIARRPQLLYQQQLPRSRATNLDNACHSKFGEKDSNLPLLVQSQAAYR
jgi:hypothetical protein